MKKIKIVKKLFSAHAKIFSILKKNYLQNSSKNKGYCRKHKNIVFNKYRT
jgi:hypothetical protein